MLSRSKTRRELGSILFFRIVWLQGDTVLRRGLCEPDEVMDVGSRRSLVLRRAPAPALQIRRARDV